MASTASTAGTSAQAANATGAALELHPEVRAFFAQYYSPERLHRLLCLLAVPPAQTTIRVNTLRTTREELIAQLNAELATTPFRAEPHPLLADMVVIPSGSSQRPARAYPEVVVTRKTGEALMRGAELYAPGVLAAEKNISAGDTVSVTVDVTMRSLRGAVVDRGYGDLFLGNGVAEMSRSEIFRAPSGLAVRFTERVHNAPGLNGVLPGLMYLQNLPSAVVAHVLAPRAGERVLDACAAPGGKTTHIAQLMGDRGTVYALDRTKSKARPARPAAPRDAGPAGGRDRGHGGRPRRHLRPRHAPRRHQGLPPPDAGGGGGAAAWGARGGGARLQSDGLSRRVVRPRPPGPPLLRPRPAAEAARGHHAAGAAEARRVPARPPLGRRAGAAGRGRAGLLDVHDQPARERAHGAARARQLPPAARARRAPRGRAGPAERGPLGGGARPRAALRPLRGGGGRPAGLLPRALHQDGALPPALTGPAPLRTPSAARRLQLLDRDVYRPTVANFAGARGGSRLSLRGRPGAGPIFFYSSEVPGKPARFSSTMRPGPGGQNFGREGQSESGGAAARRLV